MRPKHGTEAINGSRFRFPATAPQESRSGLRGRGEEGDWGGGGEGGWEGAGLPLKVGLSFA